MHSLTAHALPAFSFLPSFLPQHPNNQLQQQQAFYARYAIIRLAAYEPRVLCRRERKRRQAFYLLSGCSYLLRKKWLCPIQPPTSRHHHHHSCPVHASVLHALHSIQAGKQAGRGRPSASLFPPSVHCSGRASRFQPPLSEKIFSFPKAKLVIPHRSIHSCLPLPDSLYRSLCYIFQWKKDTFLRKGG